MNLHRRAVETITPENAGWGYSGLHIVTLAAGGEYRCDTGEDEVLVLPLAGSCTVEAGADGATPVSYTHLTLPTILLV